MKSKAAGTETQQFAGLRNTKLNFLSNIFFKVTRSNLVRTFRDPDLFHHIALPLLRTYICAKSNEVTDVAMLQLTRRQGCMKECMLNTCRLMVRRVHADPFTYHGQKLLPHHTSL